MNILLKEIIEEIQESEKNGILSIDKEDVLSGYSGDRLVGMLQRLGRLFSEENNVCYLEIGVFQGLTLLSVASTCPKLSCYGIDNFAYFDPANKNFDIVKARISKLGIDNANIINKDYEDALENLKTYISDRKIALYFVDGPHDYRSQLMCLELALPYLHEQAIIVVDDSNYRHVRQANRDFLITHPQYKLIFEAYTQCHPKNMTADREKEARQGWWNGVNVLVRDIDDRLDVMYPPTERSRLLYENEHIVHAANLAKFAPDAINLIQQLDTNILKFIIYSLKMKFKLLKNKNLDANSYQNLNTYSDSLTRANYNELTYH
jgi:predicted O-methyltransferase YrrM